MDTTPQTPSNGITSIETHPLLKKPTDNSLQSDLNLRYLKLKQANPCDHILNHMGFSRYQIILTAICSIGTFVIGTEALLQTIMQVDQDFANTFHTTPSTFTMWTFCTAIAGALAGGIAGPIIDIYGRRRIFLGSMIIYGIFGVCSGGVDTMTQLIIIRTLANVAGGFLQVTTLVYFLEQIPARHRGRAGMSLSFFMIFGYLYIASLGYVFSSKFNVFFGGMDSWRCVYVFAAIPAFLAVILQTSVTYESARYLLKVGRPREAHYICRQIIVLNQFDDGILPPMEEFIRYSRHLAELNEEAHRVTYWQKFKRIFSDSEFAPSARWAFLAWGLLLMAVGSLVVLASVYVTNETKAYLGQAIAQLMTAPGFGILCLVVDRERFGRLPTLRGFLLLTLVSAFLIMVGFDDLFMIGVCLTLAFVVPTMALLVLYLNELFPTELRATGNGILSLVGLVFSLPLGLFFSFLMTNALWAFGLAVFVGVGLGSVAGWQLQNETVGEFLG